MEQTNDINRLGIRSQYILKILEIIKKIQKRMNDPDIKDLEYARTYDKISREPEFDEFFNKYTSIFIKVVRGESLDILAANLFYLDKVVTGEMKESDVADMLAKRFLPENLKQDSDVKLKEMKENGTLLSNK